jgi:glycosyltransferase involved in cell wall biosynthesis
VAIVQPGMAPYRFACFSALASQAEIDLLVVYLSRGRQPYDWSVDERAASFPRVDLAARSAGRVHPWALRLVPALRRFRPDVTIVGGWDEPAYHLISMLRPRLGRNVVVWTESTGSDRRPARPWRDALKRGILDRADALLVPGAAAREYAQSIAPHARRWFVAPNAVDNDRIRVGAALARRRRSPDPGFLYVGRLDPEKGVDVLLRAWAAYETRTEGRLSLAGAGSEEPSLRRLAGELNLKRVTFHGFVPQAQLPNYYGQADVFVFPSLSDPWGMVINEAMAAGLPIITTTAPGGARELVRNGENGLLISPGDPQALAEAIDSLATDQSLRERMGRASRDIVQAFSPTVWATAVTDMVRALR